MRQSASWIRRRLERRRRSQSLLWRERTFSVPTFSERRCPPGHAGRLSLSLASLKESRQAGACPPGCESPLCLLPPFSCLKTIGFVLHQNENCYNFHQTLLVLIKLLRSLFYLLVHKLLRQHILSKCEKQTNTYSSR